MRKVQDRDPILIHQMGKVGSSAIAEALSCQGLSVLHLHALNPKTLSVVKAHCRERGLAFPPHIQAAQRVWDEFITPGRPLQIISVVRDPMARNISAYFENLQFFHLPKRQEGAARILSSFLKLLRLSRSVRPSLTLGSMEVGERIEEFLTKYPASIPLRWFDHEVRDVLGVNVYHYPFPKAVGFQVICEKRIQLLILRAEAPDALKSAAIQKFVALSELKLARKNRTSQKHLPGWYQAFLQQLRPPDTYLQKVYESRYMRHFYTPEEIQQFRECWTREKEPMKNEEMET